MRLPVLWLMLATGLGIGCGARPEAPRQPDLADLRARAEQRPSDVSLQRMLAEAEMFHPLGEAPRVGAQLKKARALAPRDMRVLLLSAIEADVHGRPDDALAHFIAALSAFSASRDPYAGQMAELSVHALAALEGGTVGYQTSVERSLSAVVDRLPAPARWAALDLLIHLAYLRDDGEAVAQLAAEAGCLTEFTTAGPFGPRDLLAFDQQHGVDVDAALAPTYDLGPARGVRDTRRIGARGCSVNFGGDPIAAGGVRYATTTMKVVSPGRHYLRFDSPNTAEVFLNGESLLRVDRRRDALPRVTYLPVELAAGVHRVTIKLASRHPDPVVRIAWLEARALDTPAVAVPPRGQGPFALYLRATLQLIRGDAVGGRFSLRDVAPNVRVSPLLLAQRANALFNDPLSPTDVREDAARRLLIAAVKRDPDMWNPTVQLASLAANNGRVTEAIDALRDTLERFPRVPAVGLSLVELLDSQQWYSEADGVIAKLRRRVPDACAPMLAELEALHRRHRYEAASALGKRIMECNARSNVRYSELTRRREWQAAKAELARLSRFDPPQSRFGWKLAALELARRAREPEREQALIEELMSSYPRYAGAVIEAFDMKLSKGKTTAAAKLLNAALVAEPNEMSELWPLRPLVDQPEVLADYRRDGLAAIAEFEASGRTYSQPHVLVFDYMATRIFEDGSSIELVHTVQRAQSDEAIDELAEVEVPEGARLLTLRTIKADGRVLEPDPIAGKDTLSLPSVAAGDYVEIEYMREHAPSNGFPGGYLSDRFYFQSFEIPFDHSEMVFVTPEDMVLELDPRGEAPAPEVQVQDGLRVVRFLVTESTPLSAEPGSVTAREYIPSVRVGLKATWPAFVDSIREVLVDRDVRDPELRRLAEKIVGDAGPKEHGLRARRLYDWVLENIKNSQDSFAQVATMVRGRSGNRARVLHYLLGLAGVPSSLAIARSASADTTPSGIPDTEGFEHLLVRVDVGAQPAWLFTSVRHARFGYLPALLRGQPARMLADGAPEVTLPEGEPGQDRRTMVVTVEVEGDGSAHIDIVERVTGAGAIAWRSQFEEIPPAELERRFEQDYVARLVPGAALSSLEIEGRSSEQPAVILKYGVDVEGFARRVGSGWALPPLLTAELSNNYARAGTRTTTLLVSQMLDTDVTLRYRFPVGAKLPPAPADVALAGPKGRARFSLEAAYEGRELVIRRRIYMPIMRVSPETYPEFARFCRKVDQLESSELSLLP